MNFFSKETIPDQTINKTEARIDVFRMEGAWSSVLRELEHFSDHFDQDIAVNTSQHTTSESVQAYYWVCMGEAALEIRSDVSNAMDCCLHALELDSGYSDGYIFMCRILLELSSQLLSSTNVGVKSRRRTRQYTSFVALDEDTAMADLFRVKHANYITQFYFVTHPYIRHFQNQTSKSSQRQLILCPLLSAVLC